MADSHSTTVVDKLDDLYQDSGLYSTPEMFSPPSERRLHVIRFELMTGCSWQNCTYCCGYQRVPFRNKSLDEYVSHVDAVWERIGYQTELAHSLRRVFIGGGDALGVESETLREAVKYTRAEFGKHTGGLPHRIAVYGSTRSILKQGTDNLDAFRVVGLDLIYWGVESGSTEVLKYVRKGCTQESLLKAADCLNSARMLTSIMVMPGLGGIKYYEQHVTETAKVIDAIKPAYITFMGVNPSVNSAYTKRMQEEVKEGTNCPLTDLEIAQQIKEIISRMPVFYTHLGCHPLSVDAVGYNPVPFGSQKIYPHVYPSASAVADSLLGYSIWRLERKELVKENPERVVGELKELESANKIIDFKLKIGSMALVAGGFGFVSSLVFLPQIVASGWSLSEFIIPPLLFGLGVVGTYLTSPFESTAQELEIRVKISELEKILQEG